MQPDSYLEKPRGFGLRSLTGAQQFWISVAALALITSMCVGSSSFRSYDNFFNTTRNLAFIGIIALGQTAVIISGGIDLSVGAIMAFSGISAGLTLQAGYPLWAGIAAGLGAALALGFINGVLIAYCRLSSFVVTLGMMSVARSLSLVISNNKTLYDLGPDQEIFSQIGGGSFLGLATPLWVMLVFAATLAVALRHTLWGRHLYAIGANEEAALRTGVRVARTKLSVYMLCSFAAGLSALLIVGWLGSVTNALGMGYELKVIAATVIGGTNLVGGEGGAYGAVIGAVLIEVIRNSLLLAGVNPYWQDTFVGAFIIFAVLIDRLKNIRDRE